MDLSTMFSDDQMAIMGCFAALAVCGLIAAISFRAGPAGQQQKLKQPVIPMNPPRSSETTRPQERRAA